MPHPPRFRVPATRPSVEQTARELGLSRAEFARVTRLVDAVLGEGGGTLAEHKARRPGQRRTLERSRARVKRRRPSQRALKRR